MLYYNFKDYSEFKELFGIQKHENGTKSRKNKLILSYIKNQKNLRKAIETDNYEHIRIPNMAILRHLIRHSIHSSALGNNKLTERLYLMEHEYLSSTYSTDSYRGVCEDGDYKCIRYKNTEGKIYKMRAGKLYKKLVLETEYGKSLPENVLNYMAEHFSESWQSYAMGILPQFTLHVDDDFERIYNPRECKGDFGSCMTGSDNDSFYDNAVSAKAAYLENKDGYIIARCIIFTDVLDEEGKKWKLAERQYSSDSLDIYKRLLIDNLIKENYIDGYKVIGAGCHDVRNFVDNSGNSLAHKKFRIRCSLYYDDTLSYQDSFIYYDIDNSVAYNYPHQDYSYCLDITSGYLEDDREFDSYHDRYCRSVVTVYCNGREYTCDGSDLDDFISVDGSYYHEEDVSTCDHCEEYYITEHGEYSTFLEKDFCCQYCLDTAESEYRQAQEEDPENKAYDTIHNLHCRETVEVYRDGALESCDITRLDDFTEFQGKWIISEDIWKCSGCESSYWVYNEEVSRMNVKTYCCEACYNKALEKAKLRETEITKPLLQDTYHGTEAVIRTLLLQTL